MKKRYYVTTAIAYPNSVPHLGHALEIIQADIVARFNRLLGKDVFFQTGTDEHGIKNWQTAQKKGKDIVEFLDENVNAFKKLYEKLNISYDYFIRTTDKNIHYPGAIKLWNELVKSGDIYKKKYQGLYCSGCESFKTEKELEGGKCPDHPTREIESVEEENYFFKLSKYKEQVAKIIKSDEYKIIPEIRKNEILSFLKEAKDISFSRPKTSLPWGITVPGDDSQVMYVWCDALSNYITGVGYGRDEKLFKKTWPADLHIIGKDILRFHAAFWPAMLISAKIQLPNQLLVHGFILSKGAKMSKSTGNVIEPIEQAERYGADQFRFYITGAMPMDGDGDYSEELLLERINSELVGNLSNFCYRVLSFANKNFDSKVGSIDNNPIIKELDAKFDAIKKSYELLDFKRALDEIMAVSSIGNKYFQEHAPWELVKTDKKKAQEVVSFCINIVKNLCILINPILPEFSAKLEKQLNLSKLKWSDLGFDLKNRKIGSAAILVNKIAIKQEAADPFSRADLRVAKILEVKDHPDADKLYVLNVDVGEKRQLVAGVKNDYAKEELVDKKIIVLCNLKHAKLKGIESQGMLLAAVAKDKCKVLEADKSKPGDKVFVEGIESKPEKEIDIKEFSKLGLRSDEKGRILYNNRVLKTAKEEIFVKDIGAAKIE